jgi:Lipase (class 3)
VNSQFMRYALLAAIVVAAFTYFRIRIRPAYKQDRNQVFFRAPGERYLKDSAPAKTEAERDLPFALMSQAAYQRIPDEKHPSSEECLNADKELENAKWTIWGDFVDDELQKKIRKYHLRVEVWSNAEAKKVVVAFGGTEFSDWRDWLANLRWFMPWHEDQYTVVVKGFGPAFVNEYVKKRDSDPDYKFLRDPETRLLSTGHSLGGGLAQQFAYSLKAKENVPLVKRVYVFDPSPVTGFYRVEEALRTDNSKALQIDRIYERGEILALLRSLESFAYPETKCNPAIRQVRYSLFSKAPITGHSISTFAFKLDETIKKVP